MRFYSVFGFIFAGFLVFLFVCFFSSKMLIIPCSQKDHPLPETRRCSFSIVSWFLT